MKYIESIEEFNDFIKQEKVLIDFYADWCGPCKMFHKVLEELDNENKYLIGLINTYNFLDLCKKYKVFSIPSIKVFSNGELIKEKKGFMSLDELKEFLDN